MSLCSRINSIKHLTNTHAAVPVVDYHPPLAVRLTWDYKVPTVLQFTRIPNLIMFHLQARSVASDLESGALVNPLRC